MTSRYCSDKIQQTEKPHERWHYLATCLSGSLIDYKTDALVDNDIAKYGIFSNLKVGQEIRPMNKLSDKRIEGLLTHGKVGWGEGKKFFSHRCNRRDGERKREQTRECMLLYTNTPFGR